MTHPLYRTGAVLRVLPSCLLAVVLTLLASAAAAVKLPLDGRIDRGLYPALGISDDFGRWNGTIRLVYDPDGAPAAYSDSAKVLALLQEAYSYWMLVSGVRFEIAGIDAGARDDRDLSPFQRDGLVRVSWENIGAAGQAGPTGGFFDHDLGYFPYDDGSVELNRTAGVISSDFELVGVLVHELGHLLGLGHSDSPDSVMYANPYNHLRFPRADDIRAVQVLYGAPAQAVHPDQPVRAWLYDVPPQATASATQFLFKQNLHPSSGSGAYFDVADSTVTAVTAATGDDETVWFVAGIGGSSDAIAVTAKFLVVDPAGYLYDERNWALSCPANNACVQGTGVGEVAALKTLPGTWKVYVVDPATNRTLVSMSLPVSGGPVVNRAPTATITAATGSGPAQARFTITARDPEGDAIEVVWHPPGLIGANSDVRHRFASGGSASLDVDFSQTGTHTFFVEVRDDAARYGDGPNSSVAGDGFQTLMRVTVTLPATALQVVSTQEGGTGSGDMTKQVLAAIATMPNPMLVANTNGVNAGSTATASFTYGASADGGATTKTTFRSGDNVIIAGGVRPQAADLGRAAEVFIVVRTILDGQHTWAYRNVSGQFEPWRSVAIADLKPAYTVASLQASEAFEILNGKLVAAEHRVYIGYRPSGGDTLLYTGEALRLNVSN
ncbi:MAG TPA: matrixin family metalloprotease [Pseudomonadales bacterium]